MVKLPKLDSLIHMTGHRITSSRSNTRFSVKKNLFCLIIFTQIFLLITVILAPVLNTLVFLEKINDTEFETMDQMKLSNQFQINSGLSKLAESGQTRASIFNNTEKLVEYAILAPSTLEDTLKPLADWKTQKGVYSKIFTIDGDDGIESKFQGYDIGEKIHNFLRDYRNKAPNLKWLLLVGDSEIIPARKIILNNSQGASLTNLDNFCYSDYYYSALDSVWDTNSNMVYGESGEEDFNPDLYVGRLPVNNQEEAKIVIDKIINYEQNPPTGDWAKRVILCGGLMDRPNIADNLSTKDIDEGYNPYKDNAYEVISKIWNYLPNWSINVSLLDYAQIDGGQYSKSSDTLNESNLLPIFNKGASVVNFVSHGNKNGVLHYNNNNGKGITYDYYFNHDIAKSVTNQARLPLIYSSSCTSGNFTENDDTNLERLLTSTSGGAIGFIGATVDTYRLEFSINDSSYGNWWLNNEFWTRFFSGIGNHKPGDILYNLKSDYYLHYTDVNNPHQELLYQPLYRTNLFSYNLLGDPEIAIYTDTPRHMELVYPKTFSPSRRTSELTIQILDENLRSSLANARVCLQGTDYYDVKETDPNGKVTFVFNNTQTLNLNFTVTAHNYYYNSGTIKIVPKADLSFETEEIMFEQNPVPPEAIVNFSFRVKNNGSLDLPEVMVHCYYEKISNNNLINNSIIIQNLSVDEIEQVNISWRQDLGDKEIIVILDPYDTIFEVDENNNIQRATLFKNVPPVISNLPVLYLTEDTPAINALDLSQYTWDEDTSPNDLIYSISGTNDSLLEIQLNGTQLSIFPQDNYHGSFSTLIYVFDGTSYASDRLRIEVKSLNDPPTINNTDEWIIKGDNTTEESGVFTVFEDNLIDIQMKAFDVDSDEENENLTFYANSVSLDVVMNSSSGRFMFIPDNSAVGLQIINLSVYDDNIENNCSWQIVKFNVINTNDPPRLTFRKSMLLVDVGEQVDLKAYGSDQDLNDKLSYSDNTEIFDIDPVTGNISFKPKYNQIGNHKIKITVSDGISNTTKTLILEIRSPPERELDPLFVLVCPLIIATIVIIVIIQEYFKNRDKNKSKKNKIENKEQ